LGNFARKIEKTAGKEMWRQRRWGAHVTNHKLRKSTACTDTYSKKKGGKLGAGLPRTSDLSGRMGKKNAKEGGLGLT